ncbi:hypothetical protein TWF679_007697 [Orbilia oligospora]|uniref:Uncharacterized protein n=1 Tax=Orbilia oligospora TaxID=2813651 RepID=A0A8H8V6V0_ORBOL|nr:hypothetical protein TWF679_007697 [Orbilia oligospora]
MSSSEADPEYIWVSSNTPGGWDAEPELPGFTNPDPTASASSSSSTRAGPSSSSSTSQPTQEQPRRRRRPVLKQCRICLDQTMEDVDPELGRLISPCKGFVADPIINLYINPWYAVDGGSFSFTVNGFTVYGPALHNTPRSPPIPRSAVGVGIVEHMTKNILDKIAVGVADIGSEDDDDEEEEEGPATENVPKNDVKEEVKQEGAKEEDVKPDVFDEKEVKEEVSEHGPIRRKGFTEAPET